MLWWRVYFLGQPIDLADAWNVLLGYNAEKIGLSISETVLGWLIAQWWIESLRYLGVEYDEWSEKGGDLSGLIELINWLPNSAMNAAYQNEATDRILYLKWFNAVDISPKGILNLIR